MKTNYIMNGDCIEHLKELPDNSVDAIITDPPYGIGFMGKEWDNFKPSFIQEAMEKDKRPKTQIASTRTSNTAGTYDLSLNGNQKFQIWFSEVAKECLRVLKHGGYLLSFGGTRTYHRMTCGIEDAGFEIRDCIMWIYGSGFPKSLNIGKQIDKINGRFYSPELKEYLNKKRLEKGLTHIQLNALMDSPTTGGGFSSSIMGDKQFNEIPTMEMYLKLKSVLELDDRFDDLLKKTEAEREVIGKRFDGSATGSIVTTGTGNLKKEIDITLPATEEAKEWEGWGTALKPACEPIVVARKPLSEKNVALNVLKWGTGGLNIDACRIEYKSKDDMEIRKNLHREENIIDGKVFGGGKYSQPVEQGRFPANIIFDEESAKMLDEQSGERKVSGSAKLSKPHTGGHNSGFSTLPQTNKLSPNDSGGASRFFYVAKASKSERNFGLDDFEDKNSGRYEFRQDGSLDGSIPKSKNNHPTVKPIKLMEYLIKLVTKEGAVILDPFIGSGTTAIACLKLNRNFIGIEKEPEYIKIANARIKPYLEQRKI